MNTSSNKEDFSCQDKNSLNFPHLHARKKNNIKVIEKESNQIFAYQIKNTKIFRPLSNT